MSNTFPIREVLIHDKQFVEQMGTKEKFWCSEPQSDQRWLFKYNRPNTGEDWSEKIASEIAELMGIPHATVELASCEGRPGVLTLDFTEKTHKGALVHGNELLSEVVEQYPRRQLRKVSQHSISNIIQVLSRSYVHLSAGRNFPHAVQKPKDQFLGYLMLDALIGNIDRHHENWGILVTTHLPNLESYAELAPSYDHASSLGRELSDERRAQRLTTSDSGFTVKAYTKKAVSAIYPSDDPGKPLSTIEAFTQFSKQCLEASQAWLDRLRQISDDSFASIVSQVPSGRLSAISGEFILEVLRLNKQRLLGSEGPS